MPTRGSEAVDAETRNRHPLSMLTSMTVRIQVAIDSFICGV